MTEAAAHCRIHGSLIARSERRLLIFIATRLPRSVTPDQLTALGLAGSLITLFAYIATNISPTFLWIANFGLVVHWFGDSLDGTLARVRGIERPRYGYFVDQNVDALSNLFIAGGIGASPFVQPEFALLVLAAYHMLSVSTVARAVVTGRMHVAVMGLGPTEMRLGIIALNMCILAFGAPHFQLFEMDFTWCDPVLLVIFLGLVVLFLVDVRREAAALAKLDRPAHQRRPS